MADIVKDVIYDFKVRTDSADREMLKHQKVLQESVAALAGAKEGTLEWAVANKKLDNALISANASTNKQVRELGNVANAQAKANTAMRGAASGAADAKRGVDQYSESLKKAEHSQTSFASKGNSLASMLSKAGLAFSGLMIIRNVATTAFEAATSLEASTIAFETMLKSRSKAEQLLAEITQFAEETPFQTDELERASKSLLAFQVQANDVVPTLRMLGDIASGVGMPIGELAELFGKAKVQGRLMNVDIMQLTNRGIPIITELAKVLGVGAEEIKGMVSAGKIGFPEMEAAMQSMTTKGGQFEGLTKNMSESTKGLISTAKDNFEILARTIFMEYQPSIKSALTDTINFLKGIDPEQVKKFISAGLQLVKVILAYKIGVQASVLVTNLATRAQALWAIAQGVGRVAVALFTKGLTAAKMEMLAFNAASKANPWSFLAGAIAVL